MSSSNHLPVAIVGIAAELPSGSWSQRNLDYNSFYDFLLQGGEAYEKIPPERFNIHKRKGTATGQVVTDTGAFLKVIDLFDPVEFGVTSKDARLMSLGTRKLLETTFLALLDSGIDYRGRNVGCYMSAVAHDIFAISGHDDMETRGAFSYTPAMVANRVSYHLDLRGPTVPLDTACSSTLYATHLAVQALRNGECESAVVGGCQLNHRFTEWLLYSQGGVLSPDGKCKPFDISANGFGRGEAVVSIVLKPLDAALRDRDRVYATILGTGINSSGSLAPVNAPVASAQQDAMLRAFAQAQRSPEEVDFIELHATGTASGDPTEANWVGDQFKRDGELLVGSVKGNIGHTEITAFLSSLCKVCHIIEHGVIPPTVNFTVPNPAIRWAEHRMRVPVTPEKLSIRSPSGRALIAMSSSGIGGANGHCVVESYSSNPNGLPRMWACESSTVPSLLLACGLTPRAATAVGESIRETYADQDRERISRVLGRRARSMVWRSYSVVSDGQVPRFSEPVLAPKAAPEIVFVFSGQGPQHWNMGRELFKSCVPFRETVVELDRVYAGVTGKSLISDIGLFAEGDVADPLGDVWPISVTLPALAILQIALVDTLATIGVKPTAVVGHSAGETAVIYASGTASKAMVVELAIARGQTMEVLERHDGTMAALACSSVQAEKIMAAVIAELGPAPLEIGCFNAPNAVTLSGSTTHVVSAVRRAKAAGILATRLRTKIPVHSSMMSLCQAEYEDRVVKVFSKYTVGPAKVEVFSTLTGDLLSVPHDSHYFWENTLGPVMFESAVEAIQARHHSAVFVELGPHPVLSGYISEIVGQGTIVLSPLKRSKSVDVGDVTPFMDFVGRLVCAGYSFVDIDVLCGSTEGAGTTLPPYPFARKQVPYVAPTFEITRQRQLRYGPLNYPQLQINTQTHPELADHIIKNEPIMPAAGFLEMALEFGAKRLWDVNFHSMLSLSSERPTPVNVKLEGSRWSVRSASALDFSLIWPPAYHRLHATGHLSMRSEADMDIHPVPLSDIRARLQKLEMKNFYDSLASFANYGSTYRRVLSCYHGVDGCGLEELLVEIRGAANDLDSLSYYCLHPAILDAALHVAVHPLITGVITDGRYYLPSRVGALTIHDALEQGIPDRIYAYGVFVSWTPESLTYDFKIANESGLILCSIEALEVVAHGQAPLVVQNRYEVIYHQLDIRLPTSVNDGSVSTRAHEVVLGVDSTPKDGHSRLQIFQYRRGHEMDLQRGMQKLNATEAEALCFIASEGMDGDAVLGFTRSLRKEYHPRRVFCVVFPSSRPLHDYEEVARALCAHPLAEEEMSVYADGSVQVARVASSSAPKRMVNLDRARPWAYVEDTVSQVLRPAIPPDHVLVHITGLSPRISPCQTFVGHVDGCPLVHIGITFDPLANYAIAHRGSISELPEPPGADRSPDGLAIVIAVLAIGHARFNDPSRLRGSCILVTHSETSTGRNICRLYESRGFRIVCLPSQAGARETKAVLAMKPKFIVSGREGGAEDDVDKIVYGLQSGKIFQWDDPNTGITQVMAEDPWAIGDALKLALAFPADFGIKSVPPIELLDTAPPVEVPAMSTIFDPDKAYILVGGIGGLGLPIAYWMYNNGAREIVLTSRGGVMKLGTREEFIAFRLLRYLQSQADLVLRTEAVEASSIEQTKRLVDSITKPIGGCMILAAVLSDRTFAKHTSKTFEIPYTSKLGAFDALERALDIDSLDFLLAYSSIAGLAGNAGQTNYSSANTALTGLTRRYRNSVTLVPPMINDTGFFLNMAATDSIQWSRYRHLNACAMTCDEICECIGEALLKLREGPLWQYIPDYNWGRVQSNLGSSPLYDYLVTKQLSSDVDQTSADEPQCILSDIICDVLDIDHEDLSPDVPLTSYGLDSLSATALSHALAPYLIISQLQLLADVTLAHLEQLREGSSNATTPEDASIQEHAVTVTDVDGPTKKAEEMMVLLQRYSSDLPSRGHITTANTKRIIFLTGSTGSVGSHVLAHFLSHSPSEDVFALVRRDPSGMSPIERLTEVFKARELDASSLMSDRLIALEGDMTMPTFGLSAAVYQDLLQSVTHIVHLAWPIDFVTPLSALEPHIRGVRYLIDFAASSAAQVKFLFSSTAGMFRRLPDRKPLAEVLVTDPLVAVGSGYSESKWVAERLISLAGKKNILSPTIVRFGQLSGSARNGVWRTSEWIPSMVSASVALGCLPDARGEISWLPVDAAAAGLADLIDCPAEVLHLRHPQPVAWQDVFADFASVLALPLVPYADWITRLERGLSLEAAAPRGLEHGLRLLEIFRSAADADEPAPDVMGKIVPRVDITHALEHSSALREGTLPQIGSEDVRRWIEYWRSEGFLPDGDALRETVRVQT